MQKKYVRWAQLFYNFNCGSGFDVIRIILPYSYPYSIIHHSSGSWIQLNFILKKVESGSIKNYSDLQYNPGLFSDNFVQVTRLKKCFPSLLFLQYTYLQKQVYSHSCFCSIICFENARPPTYPQKQNKVTVYTHIECSN